MKYKVIEDVLRVDGTYTENLIPAGTIINLEPIEEVKVKAFKAEISDRYWFIDLDTYIESTNYDGLSHDKRMKKSGNCFRTKEDAQIVQAKVIELFNSFK